MPSTKNVPVYKVRSAESKNSGALIRGAARDGARIAEAARSGKTYGTKKK